MIGGPADGAAVNKAQGLFRWIDPVTQTGHASPAPGRSLYRARLGCWEFAGQLAWRCRCGAVQETEQCGLCQRRRPR